MLKSADPRFAKWSWVAKTMLTEALDEMHEVPEATISVYLTQFGRIMEWCGTGDMSVLPPEMAEYISKRYRETPMIESGE